MKKRFTSQFKSELIGKKLSLPFDFLEHLKFEPKIMTVYPNQNNEQVFRNFQTTKYSAVNKFYKPILKMFHEPI
ncbi:MAG: hypothetical protein RLZZ546_1589 [Bacteroidota bacterium]|jgi:hypothetical protein